MSKGPKTRGSYGPTSPRGIYSRSMAAPGKSLDMPDEPVKKRSGGKIAKFAKGGHPDASKRGSMPVGTVRHSPSTVRSGGAGTDQPFYSRSTAKDGSTVTVEELPGMKKGGKVSSSASKRADGCAVRGKTRGKMV